MLLDHIAFGLIELRAVRSSQLIQNSLDSQECLELALREMTAMLNEFFFTSEISSGSSLVKHSAFETEQQYRPRFVRRWALRLLRLGRSPCFCERHLTDALPVPALDGCSASYPSPVALQRTNERPVRAGLFVRR